MRILELLILIKLVEEEGSTAKRELKKGVNLGVSQGVERGAEKRELRGADKGVIQQRVINIIIN